MSDGFKEEDHPRAENGQFGSGSGAKLVATITGEEIAPRDADKKTLQKLAEAYYQKHLRGQKVYSSALKQDVLFSSAKKSLHAGANPDKLRIFAALKNVVANGVLVNSAPPIDPSRESNTKAYHYLEAKVQGPERLHHVGLMIREDDKGSLYYNHTADFWGGRPRHTDSVVPLKAGTGRGGEDAQAQDIISTDDGINMDLSPLDESASFSLDATIVSDATMRINKDVIALDRNAISVRTSDEDGHLHVSRTPISKANVCPYYGSEISGADELGLKPDKIYRLYRDPAELEKAADSFNGKPLLFGHHAINAFNHDHDKVVGSVTGVEWDAPYLYARLDIWPSEATKAIDSGRHEQLSCAYRYRAIMEPGTAPDGSRYDGRMADISGSHVALVPEGRAGPDVLVRDQALIVHRPKLKDIISMKPKTAVPSRAAASAQGAFTGGLAAGIIASLRPKLAADAKLDVLPMLKGITAKNVKTKSPALVRALDAALKSNLAKDADLDTDEVKDIVEQVAEVMSENAEAIAAEVSPDIDVTADEDDADLRALLKAKGYSDEEIDAICKKEMGPVGAGAPAVDEEGKKAEIKQAVDAALRSVRAEMVTKTAQDAAISAAVDGAVSAERQRNRDIREAEAHVAASPVGKLAGAFDSAPDVYRAGLSALGVKDVDKLHDSALRPVFDAHAGVRVAQTKAPSAALAADSAVTGKSFAEMFPGSARFIG